MIDPDVIAPSAKPLPRWVAPFALWIVGLFPVVSLSLNHGGSTLYALLVLTGLVYAWPQWRALEREERWLVLGYVLLFGVALLSFVHVQDWDNSYRRLHRIFRISTFGLMYLVLLRARLEPGRLFLWGVAAAAVWVAAQGWYEVGIRHAPMAVGLYHHIIFGDMSVLVTTVLVAAALTVVPSWPLRAGVAVLVGLACYGAIVSLARGSWLFVPIAVILLALLYRRYLMRHPKWLIAGVLVVCAVVAVAWGSGRVRHQVQRTVTSVKTFIHDPAAATSAGERLNLWRNSVLIWEANPILGTGLGDFKHDNVRLIAEGRSWSRSIATLGQAQSIYFSALATMGIVGLIVVVLTTIVIPFRFFLRHWRSASEPWPRFYALAGMLSVAAFATFGLTEHWLGRNPFVNPYNFYILAFAASLSVHRLKHAPAGVGV